MDGIQAAVLRIKLRQLETANQRRRNHAAHYDAALREFEGIIAPTQASLSGMFTIFMPFASATETKQ